MEKRLRRSGVHPQDIQEIADFIEQARRRDRQFASGKPPQREESIFVCIERSAKDGQTKGK